MEEDVMREVPASARDSGKRKLFRRGEGGRKSGRKTGKKKWLLLLAAVVAVGAVVVLIQGRANGQQETAAVYTEAAAERRSITKSLTSSGTLEPADSYVVSTLVSGEILSDTFEEGDLVEKDQLLYTLDSSDADTSQTQAQNSLT